MRNSLLAATAYPCARGDGCLDRSVAIRRVQLRFSGVAMLTLKCPFGRSRLAAQRFPALRTSAIPMCALLLPEGLH